MAGIASTDLFINLIQNYRIIYDKTLKDFKNTRKKEEIWSVIAKQSRMEVEAAKKRYFSLRQKYCREKRNIEVKMRKKLVHKRWVFYERLNFLDSFIHPRSTYTNDTGFEEDCDEQMEEGAVADASQNIDIEMEDGINIDEVNDVSYNDAGEVSVNPQIEASYSEAFISDYTDKIQRIDYYMPSQNEPDLGYTHRDLNTDLHLNPDRSTSNKSVTGNSTVVIDHQSQTGHALNDCASSQQETQSRNDLLDGNNIPTACQNQMSSANTGVIANHQSQTGHALNDEQSSSHQEIHPRNDLLPSNNIPISRQNQMSSTIVSNRTVSVGNPSIQERDPSQNSTSDPDQSYHNREQLNIELRFNTDRSSNNAKTGKNVSTATASASTIRQNTQPSSVARGNKTAQKSSEPTSTSVPSKTLDAIRLKMDSTLNAINNKITDKAQRSPHAPFLAYLGTKLPSVPEEMLPRLEREILDLVMKYS